MSDTATTMTFGEKLLALYAKVAYLQKGGYNEHFRFSFVQESAVKAAVQSACREVGLVLAEVLAEPIGECLPHKAVIKVTVRITEPLTGGSQPVATMQGIGSATDVKKDGTPAGDKACMKAMAAALKYALTSGLLIATGDDPEANENTQHGVKDVTPYEQLLRELQTTATPEIWKVDISGYRDDPRFPELMLAYKDAVRRNKE